MLFRSSQEMPLSPGAAEHFRKIISARPVTVPIESANSNAVPMARFRIGEQTYEWYGGALLVLDDARYRRVWSDPVFDEMYRFLMSEKYRPTEECRRALLRILEVSVPVSPPPAS